MLLTTNVTPTMINLNSASLPLDAAMGELSNAISCFATRQFNGGFCSGEVWLVKLNSERCGGENVLWLQSREMSGERGRERTFVLQCVAR
jgi:hypothetical protein